ncbi:MAG: ATP-binding protein [Lachnospiraceae bacterium]|nr:ATP-binding protein [Lachnospiraceae bacterium]
MREKTVQATLENLDEVMAFVEEQMEVYHCSMKMQMQIAVAVEEIYVNIASYAYREQKGNARIRVQSGGDPLQIIITFEDDGIPYNPLLKEDPDITLSAEERKIGGLGIYIVKKSMDQVEYHYQNGKNILTIRKDIQ